MARELRPDGVLTLVAGASRSGKTAKTILETDNALPLLVWDPEGQWAAMRRTVSLDKTRLRDATLAGFFGRYSYTAPITREEFEFFCTIAFAWARLVVCSIVVEELADVTHPGKAPAGWGTLLRRGLKYGANIYGITQAPAESDKTIIRNAGRKWCFSLERAADRLDMARTLDVPLDVVASLAPLEFIEKIRGADLKKGRLDRETLRRLRLKPSF